MSKHSLELERVSFQYDTSGKRAKDSVQILNELSMQVKPGEFVSLLGPSGSGKSTIFRLITGLEKATAGRIKLDGEEQASLLGKVGYMPQQDLLLPWRTVLHNACLPLELKGISKKEAEELVRGHLKEFGLEGYEQRFPHELSGGMKQRVSFLRAVLGENQLLLLDEPFSALDAITRVSMQEWLLEKWEKWGKSILFITHDVEEALFLSDRICIITDRPVHQLEELIVPIKRPRSLENMTTVEVSTLKYALMQKLRGRNSL